MKPEVNRELAKKVLEVVDSGLVNGLGEPKPGQMCVEAAVNYALGAPHGDQPACVGVNVDSVCWSGKYQIGVREQCAFYDLEGYFEPVIA